MEALVVKIYTYFDIYVPELEEFVRLDLQVSVILKRGSTWFLSLHPSVYRIIQIYYGLKYFILKYTTL